MNVTQRMNHGFGGWKQFVKRVICKWTTFWREAFLSIADEEMRLQHQDLDRQAGKFIAREEPQGAMQRSGD